MASFTTKIILTICLPLLVVAAILPITQSYLPKYSGNSTLDIDPLNITVSTNKKSYYLRETVDIKGNLTQDSSIISNGLVAIDVRNPSDLPITFRTEPTGDVSLTGWPVDFTALYPCDSNGNPKYSFTPKQNPWIRFTVKNHESTYHQVTVAISLYDGNNIPLGAWYPVTKTLDPAEISSQLFMATIPDWAYPGNATIFANIYTKLPKNYGVPYCPEKTAFFEIKRNPDLSYYSPPISMPPTVNGTYLSNFKLSPETKPGKYTTYVSTRVVYTTVQNTTTFEVESASYPPQASFTYYPIEPYVNMTITFDASSSSAEGYNDTIVQYEWDFDDGTEKETKTTPTITHAYSQVNTYIVTLNVTDNEGLWSTTSKPITILPPTGPTANFTWTPTTPRVNASTTFDAISSVPGWNGTGEPPIVNYQWDFGDGNITSTGYPTITHHYSTNDTYTVTLTITDSDGATSNKTQQLTVQPQPELIGDINGDGWVDLQDFFLASQAFGSSPGSPNWNPNADLNGDDFVDLQDFFLLSQHFGEHI